MILVDSSVWIDFFKSLLVGDRPPRPLLRGRILLTGDLILAEVLKASERITRWVGQGERC